MELNLKKHWKWRSSRFDAIRLDPSLTYHISGGRCLFFVQSSLSLFVATWPDFLYNFLTFQSGPHCTAQLGVSVGNLSSIVSQLEASLTWAPLSPLAVSVLSQLSVPALTADCCSPLACPDYWLSLASHDPVRTRWAEHTHTPPPNLNSRWLGGHTCGSLLV